MSNFLSKLLVQLHLVVSIVALAWAGSIYFAGVDWGWKEPRKLLDYAVASEYDKRLARVRHSYQVRDMNYPGGKPALARLRETERLFAQNILWYDQELTRLAVDPDPIKVKAIKYTDGKLDLDPPGKAAGRPAYRDDAIPEIEKSIKSYKEEVMKILKVADDLEKNEFNIWVEKQKEVTRKLNGLDDGVPAKRVRPGLIELQDEEYHAQAEIRREIDYLTPRETDFRNAAEIYRGRREILQRRLAMLNKLLDKGP